MEKKKQEYKMVYFKAGKPDVAIINALRKKHYLMNQSDVVRMLIAAGAESILGKDEVEKIRKKTA